MKKKMSAAKSISHHTVSSKKDRARSSATASATEHLSLQPTPTVNNSVHALVPAGQSAGIAHHPALLIAHHAPLSQRPTLAHVHLYGQASSNAVELTGLSPKPRQTESPFLVETDQHRNCCSRALQDHFDGAFCVSEGVFLRRTRETTPSRRGTWMDRLSTVSARVCAGATGSKRPGEVPVINPFHPTLDYDLLFIVVVVHHLTIVTIVVED